MTEQNKKELEPIDDFLKEVATKLPKDKETADKVAMVLDIAKMFSEAKRKEG